MSYICVARVVLFAAESRFPCLAMRMDRDSSPRIHQGAIDLIEPDQEIVVESKDPGMVADVLLCSVKTMTASPCMKILSQPIAKDRCGKLSGISYQAKATYI